MRGVHRDAAAWFAASGDLAAAVRHALAGDDRRARLPRSSRTAGGWRLIYRGQGHLGAILRSVCRALGGAAEAPPRLLLGAAVVAAKGGDIAGAGEIAAEIAARGLDRRPELADEAQVLDALIRLYLDRPLPEPDLDRLIALIGRMSGEAPMTLALATNLAAYFTLQRGSFAKAKRYGERAIRVSTRPMRCSARSTSIRISARPSWQRAT